MKFYLHTNHPVALDSPDHIEPRATAKDNSTNLRFNEQLRELMGDSVSVLDLGCAGGGMVKTLIDEGHIAVGLEGSDYNLLHQRAEWATIPDNLFTCDVSKPFILYDGNPDMYPYQFNVVTGWEFFEHIKEDDLPMLMHNIRWHIKPGGLVICSISDCGSVWKVIDYHQTRKPADWWEDLFRQWGFVRRKDIEKRFSKYDWVRAVKYNFVFQEAPMAIEILNPTAAERLDALV